MTIQLRHLQRPTSTPRVAILTKPQSAPTLGAAAAFVGRTAGLGGALLVATGALHGTAASVAIVGIIGIAAALLTWGE
jgi:hypothetical protein